MKPTLSLVFCICITLVRAQVSDNFSDGNFTNNPVWFGDDSLWQVNAQQQLQSKGSSGSSKDICLLTASTTLKNCEWNFWLRFNFSPSTQNFCRYYLCSDQPDLKGSLNGYYVQLGGSTGSTDSISLYVQQGAARRPVISGRPATVAKTSNIVWIKVLRDSAGTWKLYSDTSGTQQYQLEGSAFDTAVQQCHYSGFFARFSSSNVSNFYLDDVYIGPAQTDTLAPVLLSSVFLDDSTLQLVYNEKLLADSASLMQNFRLDTLNTNPESISLLSDEKTLHVSFANSFQSPKLYRLSAKGLLDKAGNRGHDTAVVMLYYVPAAQDVIINEVMADPSPSQGLPDAEFVELYNRSPYPVNLQGWKFGDASGSTQLANLILKPDSFLILCATANENLFAAYGRVMALAAFPSLNNDGDELKILNSKDEKIDGIRYDLSWYQAAAKQNGGYSLELINPYMLCRAKDNWTGSESPQGGTPGSRNFFSSLVPDTVKPRLVNYDFADSNTLLLVVDERMDSASVMNASVVISGKTIISRSLQGQRFDSLLIRFSPAWQNRESITLSLSGMRDCSGNALATTNLNGLYIPTHTAKQNDIVISEVYASPLAGRPLPAIEFIELHNRASYAINLGGWTLSDAGSKAVFPPVKIYPDSFLIVCSEGDVMAFTTLSQQVTGVKSFPSLGSSDNLVLRSDAGFVVHTLSYENTWYRDKLKESGGYTLEMIDSKNPCGTAGNWKGCSNATGGTPGKANAVRATNHDVSKPSLSRVYPSGPHTLQLFFNESLDSVSSCRAQHFSINPGLGNLVRMSFGNASLTQLVLQFADSMKAGTSYTLKADSLSDCALNAMETSYKNFSALQAADTTMLVINEILFNPFTGGADFVELYNNSQKYTDLKGLQLLSKDEGGLINDNVPLADSGYMLEPGQYYVLTTDAENISTYYTVRNPEHIVGLPRMPSMNDDKGHIALMNLWGQTFDELKYDEDMHYPLLDNKDGVSLERIDFNRPAAERTNWSSASQTSGFATPTYRNSQYLQSIVATDVLTVYPEVFSPDGDGYHDVVNLSYRFEKGAFSGTMIVYSSNGRAVKVLLNNALLGTEGTISWQGLDDANQRLPIGIYIVYFEVFGSTGESRQYKKTVVLGGKL